MHLIRKGNLASNEGIVFEAIAEDEGSSQLIFQLGLHCAQQGAMKDALLIFSCLHKVVTEDIRIPYNLGLIYASLGRHQDALLAYSDALTLDSQDIASLVNKAISHIKLDESEIALGVLNQAILLDSYLFEAYSVKGNALNQLKRYEEAISCYEQALTLNPGHCDSLNNKGVTLYELNRVEEAITCYDHVLALDANDSEALSNKGNALSRLSKCEQAIECYNRAIILNPQFVEAYSNKGHALSQLKQYAQAIECYDKALALRPNFYEALVNKGNALNHQSRYSEAITSFEMALLHNQQIEWALGVLLHAQMHICQWEGMEQNLQELIRGLKQGEKVTTPFPLLGLSDDPAVQDQCAKVYAADQYPPNNELGLLPKLEQNSKIKIGYFSADFKAHPVAFLVAELFELHDRDKFEVYGFSLAKAPDGDATRERIKKGVDHFYELADKSEIEIATLARKLNIDIAVDLTGFTQESKTKIFAYRAAPIQVNYLGYPGTMGSDYMDYLIADQTLIPFDFQQFYSEKIAYLPNSYQANDRKRAISEKSFTRKELDLPENGFVYCCFNKNYKILPNIFDIWMRILAKVEGSVLWLLEDNPSVVINLRAESQKCGVDPCRLIFAKRMPLADHLARHRAADLFLDTFPYNAHTTTSDALWTGLPVLTMMGNSFASRVSASLLRAMELPELITGDEFAYEALAIKLACNPTMLSELRTMLANNRLSAPLFDTPLFARSIEAAYQQMYDRYQANMLPEHIYIAP